MTFGVQDMEHIQRHVRQGAFKRIEYHRLVMDISIPGGFYSLLQWVLYRFYLLHSSQFCHAKGVFSKRIPHDKECV